MENLYFLVIKGIEEWIIRKLNEICVLWGIYSDFYFFDVDKAFALILQIARTLYVFATLIYAFCGFLVAVAYIMKNLQKNENALIVILRKPKEKCIKRYLQWFCFHCSIWGICCGFVELLGLYVFLQHTNIFVCMYACVSSWFFSSIALNYEKFAKSLSGNFDKVERTLSIMRNLWYILCLCCIYCINSKISGIMLVFIYDSTKAIFPTFVYVFIVSKYHWRY